MKSLILIGYEGLASFLPFLVPAVIIAFLQKKKTGHFPIAASILMVAFTLYLIGVYHFTGAGTLFDGLRYRLEIHPDQINYRPFCDVDLVELVLNGLLFVPLGFLVPVLWEKLRKLPVVLVVGASFSLLIEASQLLNNRRTDINDLILNTAGTLVGYGFYVLLDRCTKSKIRLKGVPASLFVVCIAATFAGRFFLYNEMGAAKMLYDF